MQEKDNQDGTWKRGREAQIGGIMGNGKEGVRDLIVLPVAEMGRKMG